MLKFLCFLLLLITNTFATTFGFHPSWSGEVHEEKEKCVVDEHETTACTYTNIMDSHDFYMKLLYNTNKTNALLITKMKFEDSFLDNIPKELFMIYKNLEFLDVTDTNMDRFENYDFTINHVKVLNASNNKITKLGARLTRDMKNLTSLDLSHNLIDRVNPTSFVEVASFKYLNLSHNLIKKLDRPFFNGLKTLEVLRLDHNMISEITGDFSNFKSEWKELYLQHNMLFEIDSSFISSLTKLDLSLNKIVQADFKNTKLIKLFINQNNLKSLSVSKMMETLSLSGNSESSVTILFGDNNVLRHLDLSDCNLKSMEDVMATINRFKSLVYLDLSDTHVELFDDVFKGLTNLTTLRLSASVGKRSGKVFKDLKSLVELDFSQNKVVVFDLREIENSKNLEKLNLKNCALKELRNWRNISRLFPKLREVDLFENTLNCNELEDIKAEFTRLSIVLEDEDDIESNNHLSDKCVNGTSHKPTSSEIIEPSTKLILWYSLFIVIMLLIVLLIFYVNKRFSMFSRASEWMKSSNYSGSSLLHNEN